MSKMYTKDEFAIKPHLKENERILWYGKPQQGIIFNTLDIFAIPFSIMWAGFAFFWEFSIIEHDGPLFMKLWGIPFVLVGIYLLVGRFFHNSYIRKKTMYALTNNRLIIKEGKKIHSIILSNVTPVTLQEKKNNKGDISLTNSNYSGFSQAGTFPFGRGEKARNVTLKGIDDVIKVYNLMLDVQQGKSDTQ